jgi:hypothetical protein
LYIFLQFFDKTYKKFKLQAAIFGWRVTFSLFTLGIYELFRIKDVTHEDVEVCQ